MLPFASAAGRDSRRNSPERWHGNAAWHCFCNFDVPGCWLTPSCSPHGACTGGGGGQGRKHAGDCNAALLPSALLANTFGACCELSWSSGSAMASTLEAICLLKPSALPGPS